MLSALATSLGAAAAAAPSAGSAPRNTLHPHPHPRIKYVAALSASEYHLHTGPMVAPAPAHAQNLTAFHLLGQRHPRRANRLLSPSEQAGELFRKAAQGEAVAKGAICELASSDPNGQCKHFDCNSTATCHHLGDVRAMQAEATPGARPYPQVMGNSEGSFCAASDKYKFVFVHVLKNAGTETKNWLNKVIDDVRHEDCYHLLSTHSSYVRWSWGRDPYDRALSIYSMAKQYNMQGSISFEDFWTNDDRWRLTGLSPDHGKPQADFLSDWHGCISVDYLADLDGDQAAHLRRIAQLTGAEPLADHAEEFMRPEHGNVFGSAEASAAHAANGREMAASSPALQAKLEQIFEKDFRLLRTPELCSHLGLEDHK